MANHIGPVKGWTIIFLIYADLRRKNSSAPDTDLKKELQALFRTIMTLTIPDECEILIIINRINPYRKRVDPPKTPINDKTFILRLTKEEGRHTYRCLDVSLTPYMLQKSEALGEIIYKIDSNHYINDRHGTATKAENYFVITVDHGSAFGINKREIEPIFSNKDKKIAFNTIRTENGDAAREITYVGKFTPKNLTTDHLDNISSVERSWEGDIYNYQIDSKTFFQLDENNEKDRIYNALLQNSKFTNQVDVLIKKNSIIFSTSRQNLSLEPYFEEKAADKINSIRSDLRLEGSNVFYELDIKNLKEKKTFDILTNEELRDVLVRGLGSKRLSVLLMYNCIMMNVHSCYALKRNVKYFVAPQTMIDTPGYDFEVILKKVFSSYLTIDELPIGPKELAAFCVESTFAPAFITKNPQVESWALFAMDLKGYNRVADLISDAAGFLYYLLNANQESSADLKKHIYKIREISIQYDKRLEYHIVDFLNWFENILIKIEKYLPQINVNYLIQIQKEIVSALCDTLVIQKIGARVKDDERAGLIKANPTGLGIYFPPSLCTEYENYLYFINGRSINQSAFIKDKYNWISFIDSLVPKQC